MQPLQSVQNLPVEDKLTLTYQPVEQLIADVESIQSLYVLNIIRERIVKQRWLNPFLTEDAYDQIWKVMHSKARSVKAYWNPRTRTFISKPS